MAGRERRGSLPVRPITHSFIFPLWVPSLMIGAMGNKQEITELSPGTGIVARDQTGP